MLQKGQFAILLYIWNEGGSLSWVQQIKEATEGLAQLVQGQASKTQRVKCQNGEGPETGLLRADRPS